MQRRVPDISKIKKAIDWEPKHSLDSIIDGVATSLKS
jgi:UDP-glucose 4-epimerase